MFQQATNIIFTWQFTLDHTRLGQLFNYTWPWQSNNARSIHTFNSNWHLPTWIRSRKRPQKLFHDWSPILCIPINFACNLVICRFALKNYFCKKKNQKCCQSNNFDPDQAHLLFCLVMFQSVTEIFIVEKEKWTNKGTDKQYVAVFFCNTIQLITIKLCSKTHLGLLVHKSKHINRRKIIKIWIWDVTLGCP